MTAVHESTTNSAQGRVGRWCADVWLQPRDVRCCRSDKRRRVQRARQRVLALKRFPHPGIVPPVGLCLVRDARHGQVLLLVEKTPSSSSLQGMVLCQMEAPAGTAAYSWKSAVEWLAQVLLCSCGCLACCTGCRWLLQLRAAGRCCCTVSSRFSEIARDRASQLLVRRFAHLKYPAP